MKTDINNSNKKRLIGFGYSKDKIGKVISRGNLRSVHFSSLVSTGSV